MATERDQHIQRIVERARRNAEAQPSKPMRVRRAAPVTPPVATKNPTKNTVKTPTRTPVKTSQPVKKEAPVVAKKKSPRERMVWPSLFMFFVAGFLFLSTISYLKYWRADSNLAFWSELMSSSTQDALNWGGRLGAIVSQDIIGRWLGIFGLLIPVAVVIVAIKLLRIPNMKMNKSIRSTLIIMFTGSVVLGHFMGMDVGVFGSGWGGEMGIYVAQWLGAIIGEQGTSLLLVLGALGILYFVNADVLRRFYHRINHFLEQSHQRSVARKEAAAERARVAAERQQQERLRAAEAQARVRPLAPPPIPIPVEQAKAQITPQTEVEVEIPKGEFVDVQPPIEEIEPQPMIEIKPPMKPSPVLIPLDNGMQGCLLGYDYDSVPIIYYMDVQQFIASRPIVEPAQEEVVPEFELRTVEPVIEQQQQFEIMQPAMEPFGAKVEKEPGFIVEQFQQEVEVDDRVINLSELYDPTAELSGYRKPPVGLMQDHSRRVTVGDQELLENKAKIVHTLDTFGIKIDTIEATIGPTVTLYEIVPAPGVRISKIKNLEDDIALALSALGIRIIAPIPGKGTIGIEVPNKDKEIVSMYSVIKSAKFQDSKAELPIALGKTIQNETYVLDLAKMPHLLVAGATGQGKSVGLNAIITSLLYKKHPAELKFILVDPKKVELTLYSKLEKHFLAKMSGEDEAIITDTQKVIYTLNSLCIEMDARYDLLKLAKVRNIKEYNEKFVNRRLNPEKGHRYLPYFVVIIDEFADLIMTAGREVETPIARIAQLARAVGIHLIIATQRPTTNIITGVIKANFPARIAFRVSSQVDSRTILDHTGANQLVGQGDMLVSTGSEMTRVQCAFIDTPEVEMITEHIGKQKGYFTAYELPEYVPESEQNNNSREDDIGKRDSLFEEVARYVVSNQTGSASTIQRKFSIGFVRAGRLVDQLEAAGVVGRADGSKARQVLMQDMASLENIL